MSMRYRCLQNSYGELVPGIRQYFTMGTSRQCILYVNVNYANTTHGDVDGNTENGIRNLQVLLHVMHMVDSW